jgi:uncharacterized protein (TIGR02996 family)
MNPLQHEAFLRASDETPDDDAPLLVYADWLDDQGQPERAELIRVQCRRARLPPQDPRWPALRQREDQLLAAHKGQWVPTCASRKDVYTIFARGLLDYLGGPLTDDDLRDLAGHRELRSLTLEGEGITDAGLPHLLTLPRLEALCLSGGRITNEGLRILAGHPRLRVLGGSETGPIDDEGLRHLMEMPRLLIMTFHREGNEEVFSAGALEEWFERRRRRWRGLSPEEQRRDALYLFDHVSGPRQREGDQVKRVSLRQCTLRDADLEFFTAVPEVEEIELYQTPVTGSGLHHLAGLKHLRILKLQECDHLNDLSGLAGLTGLQQFHVERYSSLTDEATAPLETLTGLRSLSLAGEQLTEATLQRLARLPRLESLELFNCAEISGAGLAALTGLKQFRSLGFFGSARITGAGFAVLANCRRLEVLRAVHGFQPALTEEALRQLGRLSNLKAVDLGSYAMSNSPPYAALRHLQGLKDLQWLALPGDSTLPPDTADELVARFPTIPIAVGCSILKRTEPDPAFTRRSIDEVASLEVPAGWDVLRWESVEGFGRRVFLGEVQEGGFRHAGLTPPAQVAARVWVARGSLPPDRDVWTFHREMVQQWSFYASTPGEPLPPVRETPGADEAYSWRYTSYQVYECLDFAWRCGRTLYSLRCVAYRARLEYLKPYFLRMARSFALEGAAAAGR